MRFPDQLLADDATESDSAVLFHKLTGCQLIPVRDRPREQKQRS